MLGRIISALVSYWMGRLSEHPINDGLLAHISAAVVKKIVLILGAVAFSMMIFMGGLATVLTDLIVSSRGQDTLALSNVSIVGFALIVIAAGVTGFALRAAPWQVAPKEQVEAKPSPLNQALAELVMDFVKERRASRLADEPNDPHARTDHASEAPPVYM